MSKERELLKRALACRDIGYPLPTKVVDEIETYLSQPITEPEPVAFMKPSGLHKNVLLPCHPGDLGGFPVYASPKD